MGKLKIYLDTSVFSSYFDERVKIRSEQTKIFWQKLVEYDGYISQIVLDELGAVTDDELGRKLMDLIKEFQKLDVDSEVEALADQYIKRGIFPEKYRDDALHLAVDTVNDMDILISWNFEHLVKRKTRLEANLANSLNGYKSIDIIVPPEL